MLLLQRQEFPSTHLTYPLKIEKFDDLLCSCCRFYVNGSRSILSLNSIGSCGETNKLMWFIFALLRWVRKSTTWRVCMMNVNWPSRRRIGYKIREICCGCMPPSSYLMGRMTVDRQLSRSDFAYEEWCAVYTLERENDNCSYFAVIFLSIVILLYIQSTPSRTTSLLLQTLQTFHCESVFVDLNWRFYHLYLQCNSDHYRLRSNFDFHFGSLRCFLAMKVVSVNGFQVNGGWRGGTKSLLKVW